MQQNKLILCLFTSFLMSNISAQSYYVDATSGNDSNTGASLYQAFKTIQKGLNSLPSGATLLIKGGTYNEKVTVPASCNGTTAKPTIIRSVVGETAVLDGQNVGVQWEGVFLLKNNQFITLKGLKTQNGYWYGFDAETSNNIVIDSCATFNTRASGIYVRDGNNMTITNNNVRKACQWPNRDANGFGTQEDITVTGVNNFKISRNEIWDSTVSGNAGGEGIDAKGGSYEGEISFNYVHDIVPLGIYLDAGSRESYNIRIFNNRVFRTGGLGVAGELGGHAHEIYIYNNIVKESKSSGLVFQETGNGKFTNVYVVNNTFYNNAQSGFAGDIGSYTRNTANTNIMIRNNIFYNKVANSRFSIWHNYPAGQVISNNLYFDFKVSNNSTLSFNAANLTAADIQADPLFKNATTDDFSLQATSPAIDKGIPITLPNSTTPLFTTDFNGNSKGISWDMGASEYKVNTSVDALNVVKTLKLYPNPTHNYVILDNVKINAQVEIYDVLGKKIVYEKVDLNLKIDVSRLNKGLYFIKIREGNNVVRMGKVLKE